MALIAPRRNEVLTREGVGTIRFMEYLERNAEDVNELEGDRNRISVLEGAVSFQSAIIIRLTDRLDDLERSNDSFLYIQSALIGRLTGRLDDLERSNNGDILNAKISRVSARVDALIDELIDEVKNLRDKELEGKFLTLQNQIKSELELMNARIEEAFETDLTEEDL